MKRKETSDREQQKDDDIVMKKNKLMVDQSQNNNFSQLPEEIIKHILDYEIISFYKNHPFSQVSKFTRDCWLDHPSSILYLQTKQLRELLGPVNKLNVYYVTDLLQSLRYKLDILEAPYKKEKQRLEQLKKDEKNKIELINNVLPMIDLEDDEMEEMERILNNFATNINLTNEIIYNNDTLWYYIYTNQFNLHFFTFSYSFSVDEEECGPDPELIMPQKDSDWKIIKEYCKSNFDTSRLKSMFEKFLKYEDDSLEYEKVNN
ncbi:hypothetical protein ABK040_012907 [Willaertia magna]